nr:unnamed protein product [Digitaria exilis]
MRASHVGGDSMHASLSCMEEEGTMIFRALFSDFALLLSLFYPLAEAIIGYYSRPTSQVAVTESGGRGAAIPSSRPLAAASPPPSDASPAVGGASGSSLPVSI